MPIGGLPVLLVDEHVRRLYILATFGDEGIALLAKFSEVVKFDTDGVVVQVNPPEVKTFPGVPRLHVERYELDNVPVPVDHEMGGCRHIRPG